MRECDDLRGTTEATEVDTTRRERMTPRPTRMRPRLTPCSPILRKDGRIGPAQAVRTWKKLRPLGIVRNWVANRISAYGMQEQAKETTYALASPSDIVLGMYGGEMFFVRRFCHTTSLNQGCAKTSPAPFLMLPYLFEGSVSISLRIKSVALGLKNGGH